MSGHGENGLYSELATQSMAMRDAFHIRSHLSEAENLGLSVQQSTAQERHLA